MTPRDRVPDRWLVVEFARPDDPELVGLLVEELMELESRGVEEEGGHLRVYLPPPEGDPAHFVEVLRGRVEGVAGAPLHLAYRWQPHEEWSETWRRGLRPRRVTDRITVCPSWEPVDPAPGQVVILLDPGLAFGTAEHPTTRGCLRLLDGRVRPGDLVADIGAGSGILSIAAAHLGAARVVAVELDPWACEAARENVEANGVVDTVEVRAASVGPEFLPSEPPFDGVVANIESGILEPLLGGFHSGLSEGGWLILSGILAHESEAVADAAEQAGFRLEEEDREEEWWSCAFTTPLADPTR